MGSEPRYGRGKFEAHHNYIQYMLMVVNHPNFAGMPNAVSDGRINWQVSSGKSTSYYEYYEARFDWWVRTADRLGLPGAGNSNDRFTIAARLINPLGKRPCRLCGEERDVGYFYLNDRMAKKLNKFTRSNKFSKWQPVSSALVELRGDAAGLSLLRETFPEREEEFQASGISTEAFEVTRHLRTTWLSPGYMGNPPDRLDGFHDYCLYCRAASDPGRSEENLRSYSNDRRAFEWWSEGDWKLADSLFNAAGPGTCSLCGVSVERVSPDHVGPLACGFKQIPLFVPMCGPCNSAKNRRMSLDDVSLLLKYEQRTGDSPASWHVRGCWDARKASVSSDSEAASLSSDLRTIQDMYLRVLERLLREGNARFLVTLLHPEYAYFDHEFLDLDSANFSYSGISTTRVKSLGRASLARRSVRIAFEELRNYADKPATKRRLRGDLLKVYAAIEQAVSDYAARAPKTTEDNAWNEAVASGLGSDAREIAIGALLLRQPKSRPSDDRLRGFLERKLSGLGARAFG